MKKISFCFEKEKLDQAYYQGKLTAEELIKLLQELKEKIYLPKKLKKPKYGNKSRTS